MPTTSKNFVALNASAGSGYGANGVAVAVSSAIASTLSGSAGLGTVLDRFTVDLSTANHAKNGAVVLSLSPSTPVTVDVTGLSGVTPNAGDTNFGTVYEYIFSNLGAHDVTVSPGASNPANTPLGGTTPTFTVPAGAMLRWHNPAGWTVDATHKTLKFDPGANACTIALSVGGA